MAMGELLATAFGCAFLNAQGIATRWIDARTVLRAEHVPAPLKASFLSATCDFAPDAGAAGGMAGARSASSSRKDSSRPTMPAIRCCSGAAARTPPARISPPSSRPRAWRSGPTCRACSAPTRAPFRPRVCCAPCITTRLRKSRATAPRCCIRAACCRCASTKFRCMSTRHRRPASKAR